MTHKQVIRHAIEDLYGPCPVQNFESAIHWANTIAWEMVKEKVEAEHPDFQWTHHDPKGLGVAEAMILDVRQEMLHEAGRQIAATMEKGLRCESE